MERGKRKQHVSFTHPDLQGKGSRHHVNMGERVTAKEPELKAKESEGEK